MSPLERLRRGAIGLGVPIALVCSHAPMHRVRAAQAAAELVPATAIAREISPGQAHNYRLSLARGDLLRVTLEQHGIDVAAVVVDPSGRENVAVDAMDDEFRPENLVSVVDTSGIHTLTIRAAAGAGARGKYHLRLDALRPVSATDHAQIDGERAFARGRQHRDVNNAATWPGALADFTTAVDRFRSVGDRPGEMKSLIEIAVTENYLSRPAAVGPAEQAERLARALDDRPAIARVLRVLASIHALAGDYTAAARAVEEATRLNRAIGNRRAEANSLNFTANAYRRLDDLETAIARYLEALPIARAVGDRALAANILNNLAIVYSEAGEQTRSVATRVEALANARAAGDPRALLNALGTVGVADIRSGRETVGIALLLEALDLARASGDKRNIARATADVGEAYVLAGEPIKALDYYRQSSELGRGSGNIILTGYTLVGLGRTLRALGKSDAALEPLTEALAIGRRIRSADTQAAALRMLAMIERDRGGLSAARRYLEEALDLNEAAREQMTSPELRASYVADKHYAYELLIDVLQRLHGEDPAGGHAAAALQVSERARARVLLESLVDARVDLREGLADALLERERTLQSQLNAAGARLSRLLADDASQNHSGATLAVERLTTEYQTLQAEIRLQSPRYAAVTQARALDAGEIRSGVLDDDTVLLEFALGRDRSWLWAVTTSTVKSIELPAAAEIETAARSLYEQFTSRQKRRGESSATYAQRVRAADSRLATQSAQVSGMLFGGIARELQQEWRTKRLAIVASGALEYLPFAALPVPPGADDGGRGLPRPLATDHEIVSIPSASVLAVLRRQAADRPPAPRLLAIVADPVFDTSDPRLKRMSSPPNTTVDDTSTRAIDVMDSLYGRAGLSRLPFSREEAEGISALAGNGRVFKAVDFKANRASILGGALSGYRIVHLATHGVIDSERPALSSLILSLVDERGARQNGYLRLADIYNLRLDADLVVLSACDTALGREIRGEGLVGLTRAFFYAGAPRVVATLWQVSDLATSELMKKFYRGMLHQQLTPAAALRAAQLEMSRDSRWASPYFWAGFVLQGEWR